MKTVDQIRVEHLGQTDLMIDQGNLTLLVVPYLSKFEREFDEEIQDVYNSLDWPSSHGSVKPIKL